MFKITNLVNKYKMNNNNKKSCKCNWKIINKINLVMNIFFQKYIQD
jgi:hypothetical protein